MAAGLLVAASLAILGATSQDTSAPVAELPGAIERLYPEPGAVIRPQETVGVDLRDGLQAVIVIDGNRIPEDQYIGDRNLGVYQYRPGEGQEFREFEPGHHEITIEHWPATMLEDDARRRGEVGVYSWRFVVG